MNVFGVAMNTLFSDQHLRETAVYIPQFGKSKEVFVIIHKPDTLQSIGSSFIATPTAMLDVKVSDCPNLSLGDKFLIADTTYTVQGEPKRDAINLTWRVDLQ